MKKFTQEQLEKAFRNLMDNKVSTTTIRVIDTPTSETYKKRHSENTTKIQDGVAEYAEAYISSGDFFIG